MLDGLLSLISLGVGLGEELVSIDLLFNVLCLLAELQEDLSAFNSSVKFTLDFEDHTHLLMALSLNNFVLDVLSNSQTLVIEVEGHIEVILFEELISDELVNTNQIGGNGFLNFPLFTALGLLESRF